MTTYRIKTGEDLLALLRNFIRGRRFNRGAAWGMMIIGALAAFEIFNYSTTQFALADVLGDLTFAGLRWATILAVAFCGIDFAGIARIFTPQQGSDEPKEIYYLFGAWLLAVGFNAILTWWGVSVAIVNHSSASGGVVISNETITKVVPVFVAAMILFIRVLIIQTFSLAGDRLFTTEENQARNYPRQVQQSQVSRPVNTPVLRPTSSLNRPVQATQSQPALRPAPKPTQQSTFIKAEPTYHPTSYSGQNNDRSYDA